MSITEISTPVETAPVKKPQIGRMRKAFCPRDLYIVRVSRTTLINHGTPICPTCREAMTEEIR